MVLSILLRRHRDQIRHPGPRTRSHYHAPRARVYCIVPSRSRHTRVALSRPHRQGAALAIRAVFGSPLALHHRCHHRDWAELKGDESRCRGGYNWRSNAGCPAVRDDRGRPLPPYRRAPAEPKTGLSTRTIVSRLREYALVVATGTTGSTRPTLSFILAK